MVDLHSVFWGVGRGFILQESSRQHVSSFSEDVRACVCACVGLGWRGLHGSVPPPSLPPSLPPCHPPSQSRRSKVSERTAETLQTLLSAPLLQGFRRRKKGGSKEGRRTGKRVDTSEEKLFRNSLPSAEWRSGGTEPVPRSTCEPRGHRRRCFFFFFSFSFFTF